MTTEEPGNQHPVRHERSDVAIGPVLLFGAGLALFGILVHLALASLSDYLVRRESEAKRPASPFTAERRADGLRLPPEPRLEGIDPRHSLPRSTAQPVSPGLPDEDQLHRFGWVDREAGIVHVPIELAMERLTRNQPTSSTRQGHSAQYYLDSSSGRVPARRAP